MTSPARLAVIFVFAIACGGSARMLIGALAGDHALRNWKDTTLRENDAALHGRYSDHEVRPGPSRARQDQEESAVDSTNVELEMLSMQAPQDVLNLYDEAGHTDILRKRCGPVALRPLAAPKDLWSHAKLAMWEFAPAVRARLSEINRATPLGLNRLPFYVLAYRSEAVLRVIVGNNIGNERLRTDLMADSFLARVGLNRKVVSADKWEDLVALIQDDAVRHEEVRYQWWKAAAPLLRSRRNSGAIHRDVVGLLATPSGVTLIKRGDSPRVDNAVAALDTERNHAYREIQREIGK